MSPSELGLLDAADFDADYAMQGFWHPFIYRAERVPNVVYFFEMIDATDAAQPIAAAFQALQERMGTPSKDDFGDVIFELLEQLPELNADFERWSDEYGAAGNWAGKLEEFLRKRGIDPEQFWKS